MNHKLNLCFFMSLVFILIQLDLLFFNFGLQSLLATNLFLFIYPKKINWFKNSLTLLAFTIIKFITSSCLLGLELGLIFLSWLMCQILKRNLIFKKLIFYLVLLINLFLNHWLATKYIYHLAFSPNSLFLSTFLNIIAGTVIIKFFKNLLEN